MHRQQSRNFPATFCFSFETSSDDCRGRPSKAGEGLEVQNQATRLAEKRGQCPYLSPSKTMDNSRCFLQNFMEEQHLDFFLCLAFFWPRIWKIGRQTARSIFARFGRGSSSSNIGFLASDKLSSRTTFPAMICCTSPENCAAQWTFKLSVLCATRNGSWCFAPFFESPRTRPHSHTSRSGPPSLYRHKQPRWLPK